ncbi:MAG: D-alanyl-D-alanine carboxypeptidase/D-alanyl-D-alanine-endopeptidase [Bacteroidota bacterium]|nr:D-alanyl-D-alanine carboxypeptidase/D-alanyl-D-alanine-endopeptidase [Bacteroidota bacterium]
MTSNIKSKITNNQVNHFRKIATAILAFCMLISLPACKVQQLSDPSTDFKSLIQNSQIFSNHFMGFSLFDPETAKTLYSVNDDKYFIPASNTKLFTFYTCLNILGDSVPSLQYYTKGDSLFFSGTGDPTFLHPQFNLQPTFSFLKNRHEKLIYVNNPFPENAYGPGWSWDDYHYTFSAEKAPFPIYGNYVSFLYKPLQVFPDIYPSYFNKVSQIHEVKNVQERDIQRSFNENIFSIQIRSETIGDTIKIPFKYSTGLLVHLLSDTLKKEVIAVEQKYPFQKKIFYGLATDSLYKEMLWESDNFIAEQLMLMAAFTLSDTMKVKSTINYALKNLYIDMEDKVVWVDGSGLSRYNLFTPRSMVYILNKLYQFMPSHRLLSLLPAGGRSGNLKKWYKADEPYVFAKTGTLSNVHCLSGYVKTKSGKILIFSFMHNNYISTTNSLRYEMEKVLRQIHDEL